MPALWVMVGPVDDAAFGVPDVFAAETDAVAGPKPGDSWGDVDVVGKQECLAGCQFDDEALMTRAVCIVRENAAHHALTFDLDVAGATREGASDRIVVGGPRCTSF